MTFCGQSILARVSTKSTKSCGKRLMRLILYIHPNVSTDKNVMWEMTAQQCGLGLLQDSDFAGDLEDSKSTSGGVLHFWKSNDCTVGCARSKRQCRTSLLNQRSYRWMLVCVWMVYLRSTCGIWSLKCWERNKEYRNQPKRDHRKPVQKSKAHPRPNKCWIRMWIKFLPNAHLSEKESQLYVSEDNETVIKGGHQRQKSDDETHVPHPPSCSGLVT